jgi:hypothetical protein
VMSFLDAPEALVILAIFTQYNKQKYYHNLTIFSPGLLLAKATSSLAIVSRQQRIKNGQY